MVVENGALNQPRPTENCVSATKPDSPWNSVARGGRWQKAPQRGARFRQLGQDEQFVARHAFIQRLDGEDVRPLRQQRASTGNFSGSHVSAARRVRSAVAGEFHCDAAGALRRAISTPFK